jgi:hypothetical protein
VIDLLVIAVGVIVIILGWYGLVMLARRVFNARLQSLLVWCPKLRGVALVESESIPGGGKNILVVRHCSLRPDFQSCDQRCVE